MKAPKLPPAPPARPLGALFEIFEATGPMRINLTDLSGMVSVVPELTPPVANRGHSCSFCVFAKAQACSGLHCRRNKAVVNYLAFKRRHGFSGHCPLGLFEFVQPLLIRDRVIGVLYLGGVVIDRKLSERRVRAYCARQQADPAPFLSVLRTIPLMAQPEVDTYAKRLTAVAQLVTHLIEMWGLPPEHYRGGPTDYLSHARALQRLPFLVHRALQVAQEKFAEPLTLADVAREIRCHPSTLSRVFQKSLGHPFGTYLQRLRIERAKHLIALRRFSITEIGFAVGFQEKSHFSRVFKRLTHQGPQQYSRSLAYQET